MSSSRKTLKNLTIFNPRASNEWSKDESKFGQKMLEKMGWKQGQGIGLNNQGITENIKVRLKLDNKGLGYQIKEDQWLEVRSEFSNLLSQLSQTSENEDEAFAKEKKSLEAVSQSSKTRVHYHKFTHGKDIARYKKEDLVGILGKKEGEEESKVLENKEFIQSGNMDEYFKTKKVKRTSDASDHISVRSSIEIDFLNNDSRTKIVLEESSNDLNSDNFDSNSRKLKKSKKKLFPKCEIENSRKDESCKETLVNHNVEKTKENEFDEVNPPRKKKKRSLASGERDSTEIYGQFNDFNVESVLIENTSVLKNHSKEKKRVENLRDECKIEKLSENTFEGNPVHHHTKEPGGSEPNDSSLTHRKKKVRSHFYLTDDNFEATGKSNEFNLECVADENTSLSKSMARSSSRNKKKVMGQLNGECKIELNENKTSDINMNQETEVVTKCNVVTQQSQKHNDRKKIKLKKLNKIISLVSTEENGDMTAREQNESNGNKTFRKKKSKSRSSENFTIDGDINSTECNLLSHAIEEPPLPLKKLKSNSKKSIDDCRKGKRNENSNTKQNETSVNHSSTLIQKNSDEKTKTFTLDYNSTNFMQLVMDYTACDKIADYISNFERDRDELMNKYREKYKLKYSSLPSSSSNKIVVYGDEFDGRKLDCKKLESNDAPVVPTKHYKSMSKAEKITTKTRLLKRLKDNIITHDFEGTNLTNISGYGSGIID